MSPLNPVAPSGLTWSWKGPMHDHDREQAHPWAPWLVDEQKHLKATLCGQLQPGRLSTHKADQGAVQEVPLTASQHVWLGKE